MPDKCLDCPVPSADMDGFIVSGPGGAPRSEGSGVSSPEGPFVREAPQTGHFILKGKVSSSSPLPDAPQVGWAYVVEEAGEYGGVSATEGDMVYCMSLNPVKWGALQADSDDSGRDLVSVSAAFGCDPSPVLSLTSTAASGEGAVQEVDMSCLSTDWKLTAAGSTTGRALPDRFADVVNVKDFGAKGDGVTDDTIAIQSAFDYAVSKEKPCCIYFPQGAYVLCCTEPTTVRTFSAGVKASFVYPVEIVGYSAVLKANTDSTNVNILCSITTTADIFLHDITVDCNDMVETGIDIYRTPNSSGTRKPYADCRIDNITIKNVYKWSTALTDSALCITGEFRTVIIDGAIINKCVAANTLSLGNVGVYGITVNRTTPSGGETVASNNVFLNNITVEDVYCEDSSYTADQDAIRIFSNYKPDDAKINLDSALVSNVYCRNIRGRIAKCQMHYVTFNNANLVNDGDGAGFVGIAPNRGVIENQGGGVNINNMNVYVKNSHICSALVRCGHIVTLEKNGVVSYAGISYQGGVNISNVKASIVLDSSQESSFNTGFNAFAFALHGESGKNSIDNNLSGSYIFNFNNVIIESNYSFNTFVNFTRGSAVRPIFYNLSNCIASCRSTFVRTIGASTEKNISVNMVNVKNTDATPRAAFTYDYVKKSSFSNVDGFTLGPTYSKNIQNMVPVVFCNGDPQSTSKVTDVVVVESVNGICNVGILGAEVENNGETTYYNARLHLGTKSYPDVANIYAICKPSQTHASILQLGVEDTYFVVLNDESFFPSDGSNLQLGSSSSHWSSGYIDSINTKSVFTAPSSVSNDSVDVSEGTVFTKTVSADTDFSFTGVPSGKTAEFMLLLSDGGAYSVTWPSSVKWAGGTAPTLTASGTDVLRFITPDGGATWYGKVDVADAS